MNYPSSRQHLRVAGVLFLLLVINSLLLISLTAPDGASAGTLRKKTTEVRAVWMHPEQQFSSDPVRGKQQVIDFVNRIADANFNLILPWVTSEYLTALTDPSYQSKAPIAKWDAIGEIIKAANARGLQVHLWYSFTYYKTPGSPEFDPKQGGDPDWAAVRVDEREPDKSGKTVKRRMADVCPAHPAARQWELDLLDKAIARYPLATGLHIEEPGYGYQDNCVCDICLQNYKQAGLGDAAHLPNVNTVVASNIKVKGTTAFMQQMRQRLLKRNRNLVFSTNGGFQLVRERLLGRDWGKWAQDGWLDYYGAQVYTTDVDVFEQRLGTAFQDIKRKCPVYAGIGVEWGAKNTNTIQTALDEIAIARKLGAKGIILFHGKALTDAWLAALKAGPFKDPADLPVVHH